MCCNLAVRNQCDPGAEHHGTVCLKSRTSLPCVPQSPVWCSLAQCVPAERRQCVPGASCVTQQQNVTALKQCVPAERRQCVPGALCVTALKQCHPAAERCSLEAVCPCREKTVYPRSLVCHSPEAVSLSSRTWQPGVLQYHNVTPSSITKEQ